MVTVIEETNPTARKEYSCMASEFIRFDIRGTKGMLTFSEWRSVAKAKSKRWRILPGEKYINQYNSGDGRTYHFKAIPEIHAICIKYDLYPQD